MPYTEFYVKPTGSNLNAGTDENDAPIAEYISGSWDQTTRVFTPASGDPSSVISVGDFVSIYPDGSSGTVYVSRVTAVDSTTVTVSGTVLMGTAPSTGSGTRTLRVGGAWQLFGFVVPLVTVSLRNVAGHIPRINFAEGTFPVTTAITRSGSAGPIIFQGAGPGRTIIDGGTGASYVLLSITGANGHIIDGFTFYRNGSASGSSNGLVMSTSVTLRNSRVTAMRGSGIHINAASSAIPVLDGVELDGNNVSNTLNAGGISVVASYSTSMVIIDNCNIHDNLGSNTSGLAMTGSATAHHVFCTNTVIANNQVNGLNCSGGTFHLKNCEVFGNGSKGVVAAATSTVILDNTNFVRNVVAAIDTSGVTTAGIFERNCGFFGNGLVEGTNYAVIAVPENRVEYSEDPYLDADFSGATRGGNFTTKLRSGAHGTGVNTFVQAAEVWNSLTPAKKNIGAFAQDKRSMHLVVAGETAGPRLDEINAVLVSGVDNAADAVSIAQSRRSGDPDAVWTSGATIEVGASLRTDMLGWTMRTKIYNTDNRLILNLRVTGDQTGGIDVLGGLMADAIVNASNDVVTDAVYTPGTGLTIPAAVGIGDHRMVVELYPPANNSNATLSNFVASVDGAVIGVDDISVFHLGDVVRFSAGETIRGEATITAIHYPTSTVIIDDDSLGVVFEDTMTVVDNMLKQEQGYDNPSNFLVGTITDRGVAGDALVAPFLIAEGDETPEVLAEFKRAQ